MGIVWTIIIGFIAGSLAASSSPPSWASSEHSSQRT